MIGYVGVKIPGTLKLVPLDGGEPRTYGGLDRDPWGCVNAQYYAGVLPPDLVALRATISKSYVGNFSPGTVGNADEAFRLLSGCGEARVDYEVIGIALIADSDPVIPAAPRCEAHGIDCYVDGFGSPLALGIFQKPFLFPEFVPLLNGHGLFGSVDALRAYHKAYCGRAESAGLEPLEDWRDYCAYAVFPVEQPSSEEVARRG